MRPIDAGRVKIPLGARGLTRYMKRLPHASLASMSSDSSDAQHFSTIISERELNRSMRLNIIAGTLGMVWMSAAIGMPLPLLMHEVKATGFQLGLLSASWQFGMLAQLPSTVLVEHLRRRKPWWAVVSVIHRLLWGVPALLPFLFPDRHDLWPMAIIAALGTSMFLGQAGSGPWQSWMADLLPPARAGRFWGIRHRSLSASMVLAALAFGIVLDRFSAPPHGFLGFQLVFGAAAIFGTSDILCHMGVVEPPLHPRTDGESVWERIIQPLRNREFVLLTIGMAIWTGAQAMVGYTMGLPGFFAMTYVRDAFHATYAQASWLFMASGIGAVIWTPRIGHWIDRIGGREVALRLMAIGPLLMLVWLYASDARWSVPFLPGGESVPVPLAMMCVISLLLGGAYAGMWVCQVRLTQSHTTPSGRTIAMGLHWSVVGLIAALGPLAAGWIKDRLVEGSLSFGGFGGGKTGYFHVLVVLQAILAWGVAWPLIRKMR